MYRAILGRMLGVLFYHHRTPELIQKDVRALVRVPEHLSIILPYREDEGLDGLVNDVAEISAWCASAKVPMLSIYEKSGMLVHSSISVPMAPPKERWRFAKLPSFSVNFRWCF